MPEGAVQELVFGGILDWRGGDVFEIERVVRKINRLGLAHVELDADGGRCSILFDDKPVPGAKATPTALDQLVDALQELVDASDDPQSAESTLHCSAIHPGEVVETLIGVENGRVTPVSRIRPRLVEETAHNPVRTVAWRKVLPLSAALLIAFGLYAWQSGYLDRVFSAAPAEITVDTGPFGDRLKAKIQRKWGNYEITIRRGTAFPATVEAVTADKENAKGIADRAAITILSEGGTVYVHLVNSRGEQLDSKAVELRPLVEDENGKAVAKISGKIGAAGIRLALSKGERNQ